MSTEIIHIKKGNNYEITLNNRASSGLSMLYEVDKEGIVSVNRLENARSANLIPGNAVKALFTIHAKKQGSVKVTFFETQTWNKSFKNIIIMELVICVDE